MRLAPGHKLGPYEIDSPIGAGGMGEVYRARDTRLDRNVAIKILPAHLSEHADRKARFEREAKAISSISHPHICTLHDIGQDDGIDYMVMEYLEGLTLADRVAQGPIPISEVLILGGQIAGALHAAHRLGVLHRDLKPANIILTPNGVKVLDFGLAKLGTGESSSLHATHTAEMTKDPITEEGTVLGTPRYMAPEMLEGRVADVRSDLFALGAVLYEMATGKPAFEGDTRASIVGAIMKEEPKPVSDHVPLTPASFDRLVRQCMAKDPEARVQSAHDVRLQLGWSAEQPDTVSVSAEGGRRSRSWWIPLGVGLLALIVGVWWGRGEKEPEVPAPSMHVSIPLAEGTRLSGWASPTVAISPDGSRLAWVATDESGGQHAYMSDMHSGDVIRIPDSEHAEGPFFSPDGKWMGFAVSVSGRSGQPPELLKYSVERGITQSICKVTDFFGGSWLEDGTIIFSGGQPGGLRQVSASGGASSILELKDSQGETINNPVLLWPEVLPGGNILATEWASGRDGIRTVLIEGKTLEMRPLGIVSGFARYSPSGHLLYCSQDATLFAVPFDPARGAVTGSAVAVMDEICLSGNSAGVLAISGNGTFAHVEGYVRGSYREPSNIVRISRNGVPETLPFPTSIFRRSPAVSDDGTRLVVAVWEGLQVMDLTRNIPFSLLTPENGAYGPKWIPGGKELLYLSVRLGEGRVGFYRTSADGSTEPELILEGASEQLPGNFTPQADTLVYLKFGHERDGIWMLPLETGTPVMLFEESSLHAPGLSPDGRLIAYTSGETGPNEVYVRTFPDVRNRTPVSVGGGSSPRWSADGREIFYRSGSSVFAVSVGSGNEPSFGPPRLMFELDGIQGYDVAPDGSFYAVRTLPGSGIHTEIKLVTGWLEELQELMAGQ